MYFAFAIVLQARPRSFGNGRACAVRHFYRRKRAGTILYVGSPLLVFREKKEPKKTLKHKENIL